MPIPLEYPGSLLPVTHLQPGDKVRCDFCGRDVYLTARRRQGMDLSPV